MPTANTHEEPKAAVGAAAPLAGVAAPAPTPAAAPTPPAAPPTRYHASVFPDGKKPLPAAFASLILRLEAAIGCPVWCMIQNGGGPHSSIDVDTFQGFQRDCHAIEDHKPVALLLESPGGDAHCAYQIARIFQRRAAPFVTVVPNYAKSAATLMALAGAQMIVGRDAQLGPLDVQMLDREREDFGSALDAVQALERLNAFALTAIDQTMQLIVQRTKKRTDVLLPHILTYASGFVRPLLEKIDTVDFTKKSRELKVAEEYALRLMKPNYDSNKAKHIASRLVERYPTHGFVIDAAEATELGLNLTATTPEIDKVMFELRPFLDELTVIGRLQEIK